MKQYSASLFIFILVAIGAWLSRHFGWYNEYWLTDIALHTLSGVGFGYIWIALHKKQLPSSWFLLSLGTASFAVFGSVLWEAWELVGWRMLPAQTQFYVPEIGDSLLDILCGAVGGILSTLTFTKRK